MAVIRNTGYPGSNDRFGLKKGPKSAKKGDTNPVDTPSYTKLYPITYLISK